MSPMRSFNRWSPAETSKLIKAWAPVYRRRRRRRLVAEDWRAVALAVNSYCATTSRRGSCRTHVQCKNRMKHLKKQYLNGLAARLGWPFYNLLRAALADEVGDRSAGAVEGGGAPSGDDGAAADDDFGPSNYKRGIALLDACSSAAAAAAAASEGFVPAGDASRRSEVEVPDGAVVVMGAAAAGDAGSTALVDAYERARNQCRKRVKLLSVIYEEKHGAVFGAAVGVGEGRSGVEDASGDAFVDGREDAAEAARGPATATCVPPPIPKKPRTTAAKPASSSDGEVIIKLAEQVTNLAKAVTKLGGIYKDLRMKAIDVDKEKAMAGHAGVDRHA